MDNSELLISLTEIFAKVFKNPDIQPEKFETDPNVFGIHWFNGAKDAKDYCNSLNLDELKTSEPVCLIDKLVKTYL